MKKILKLKSYAIIYISPDEGLLVALTKCITIYKLPSLEKIKEFRNLRNPHYATISNDNKLLAVKSTSGRIVIFDLEKEEVSFIIKQTVDAGDGSNMVFTSDNKFLLDGDWNGNLRTIDLMNKKISNLEKGNNSMIMSVIKKNEDDYFRFHIYNRGGRNITDMSYSLIKTWKYENRQFLVVNETIKIKKHSTPFCYDSERDEYYSIRHKILDHKQQYVLRKFSKTFDEVKDVLQLDINQKTRFNIQISTNNKVMVVSSNEWMKIYILPEMYLVKTVKFNSIFHNICMSPNGVNIYVSETLSNTQKEGHVYVETLIGLNELSKNI